MGAVSLLTTNMAALFGRASRQALLRAANTHSCQKANMSFRNLSTGKKVAEGVLGAAAAGGVALGAALQNSVSALDLILHPPTFPWSHSGALDSRDHASSRRGDFVYTQV